MRLVSILAFVATLVWQSAAADVWSNNGIPPRLANGLKGVGLNSAGEWSGCNSGGDTTGVVKKVFSDGWKHFTYIVCIDDVLQVERGYAYNASRLNARMSRIAGQMKSVIASHPNAVFIVSMKSRKPIGGWDDKKILTTYLYDAFEKTPTVRDDFNRMWSDAAKALSGIPSDRLAFNIMNEPEYHNRGNKRLNEWSDAMLGAIDAIRAVSPDRVIMVEGVWKSKIGKRSPTSIIKKLPRSRIIYGFHYYEPHDFTHKKGAGGKRFTKSVASKVKQHMGRAVSFSKSKGVPVLVSEFGVWGPFIKNGKLESGVSAEDRAAYASAVYDATIPKGVGITWWALHDHNTPYQRLRYTGNKQQPKLVEDPALMAALRLR